MRNYAEEFVYWYLRLNGFFVITNFVLHSKHGDTDILGVRPPYASEFVGGKRLDEDKVLAELVAKSHSDMYNQYTCVIAEAKGGRTRVSSNDINKKFDFKTLCYTLKRIGLFKIKQVESLAIEMDRAKWLTIEGHSSTHKILFAHEQVFKPEENDKFSFISIEHVINFIENRMGLHFKIQDWDAFNSETIQYMIHNSAARSPIKAEN